MPSELQKKFLLSALSVDSTFHRCSGREGVHPGVACPEGVEEVRWRQPRPSWRRPPSATSGNDFSASESVWPCSLPWRTLKQKNVPITKWFSFVGIQSHFGKTVKGILKLEKRIIKK